MEALGVSYIRTQIANVCFVKTGENGKETWVLIDAGIPGSKDQILNAVAERFGESARPEAIILTHGHFDHVGAVIDLAQHWDVPVYAHELELPYLTGKADYPEPDPTVGGGLVAYISPVFPHGGIDLGRRVHALPQNGSVPKMPGWCWIHTPGHTEGHVSLYRDEDGTLIAGDAFITTKQESLLSVLTQAREIHGPPAYFTPDWQSSWESVRKLRALHPRFAITGHGRPMSGQPLSDGLDRLAHEFDRIAIPHHGRYVH
ncbi:MBL fold metallo-hydrolase [Alicyclobacillus dauci]|uniref:MBL fold metallo-hydrolase n=1 Tax=Alicyclobacillus dauci TaxID=1475485 RepID=A0ABY6Z8V0_9BACL|nr:MBL fold metallo-hydrolase [Alicyclobacillus dauci]WAH39257.1 MBL fold metallo-hydrolase [Alicyclobacillus dauci]